MAEPHEAAPLFRRIAILGIGLIGSSLARVIRREGDLAGELVVADHSEVARATALRLGLGDLVLDDPVQAVTCADLVILAVPVGAIAGVMERIGPSLAPGAILTDVGSTKQSVVRDALPHVPEGVHFIPGHPLAGTEHSGPESGFETLFQGRFCILTPLPGADPDAVERLATLWRRAGAMIETMDPATHDRVLAITSHLPHVIAFTICSTAHELGEDVEQAVLKFAATGFRDFTRIAGSDPVMWRDVFLNNREAILEMMGRFTEDVSALARSIRRGEAGEIEERVRRGRAIRRGVIEAKQA